MVNPVDLFINQLHSHASVPFDHLSAKQYAGISFLYVSLKPSVSQTEWEKYLQEQLDSFVNGTAWSYLFEYIRSSQRREIYQIQFRVPDEKSFCCGNECPNCILYRT